MVRTTGLVIVICGLNVGDVEPENPDDSDGVGVIEESDEGVEESSGLNEVLRREVVEVDVVEVVGEVEGGSVEGGLLVVGVGGSLVGEEGGSLSA
jgi:hypothetical protein